MMLALKELRSNSWTKAKLRTKARFESGVVRVHQASQTSECSVPSVANSFLYLFVAEQICINPVILSKKPLRSLRNPACPHDALRQGRLSAENRESSIRNPTLAHFSHF